MKKAIIGAGGFASEVYWSIVGDGNEEVIFFVDDHYWDGSDPNIYPLSKFDPKKYCVVVAIGNPKNRSDLIDRLPEETCYFTHIHHSVQIIGKNVEIGEGSIICAGCIVTTNVKIGKHAHLNLQTTVGHDCIIGDFFTTAPGAKISGNCIIEDKVYVGTNASIKEKILIRESSTIGLNAGVVKNIEDSGVYVGCPAIKIK